VKRSAETSNDSPQDVTEIIGNFSKNSPLKNLMQNLGVCEYDLGVNSHRKNTLAFRGIF
jgi:hypothetical protein